ncbi:uncharacterized protein LOC132731710 [Ruditapes philippinarum]|uniref:uncharacterized protein LOC132731710 n=1 Tax=Ruditapes philippinarum TaxID=129788 RepID=UPI00295AF5DC|nr:uncharacterized protein LOC132731710 [Ruditapes philippinarum]
MRRGTIKRSKQLLSVLLFILAFTLMTQEQIMMYISDVMAKNADVLREGKSRYDPIRRNASALVYERMFLNLTVSSFMDTVALSSTTTTTTTSTTAESRKYKTNGERNAARTIEVCKKYQNFQDKEFPITVRFNRNKSLLFCPIYKVGTTFWRRVLMIERERKYSKLINPYDLPFDREYPSTKLIWRENATNEVYKVLFTRDPFNRLFSFFVDKMLAPNPFFWKSVGVKVAVLTRGIKMENFRSVCGHDISFSEFIKYVIYTLETRRNIDPHWVEMNKNCHPCEIKYNFVGKMEEFQEDSIQILTKLGLTKMVLFLNTSGKDAAVDDAIKDTLNQPFSFHTKYKSCVSFKDALLRAWKKLQIRGLIGNDTLDVRHINETTTTLNDMIKRAHLSRHMSSSIMRKQIKDEMYRKFWSTVPRGDIQKLQKLYAVDFELFGYENYPDIPPAFHSREA